MDGVADKAWYKCTRCRHMSLLITQNGSKDKVPLDEKTAATYDPHNKYEVGQAIFHNEWNDVGRVMSKVRMSNGTNAMVVAFQKIGERQLVESLNIDLPTDQPEETAVGGQPL